jgi:hypothetical protein
MILLNHVIQVLVGPDERLSGQYAFGLQFGDGLMGRLTAVERDLLRDLVITDRFLEEAYGGLSVPKTSSRVEILAVREIISHSARSSGSSFFRWFASLLWLSFAKTS